MKLTELQKGTAVIGPAEGENEILTLDNVTGIVAGFTELLSKETGIAFSRLRISVGIDTRPSSRTIKKAVVNQLLSQGITVSDCDICSTPAIFMTTVNDYCDGAVCVTGGEEAPEMNGFRFFTRRGSLDEKQIAEILLFAEGFDASPYCERGTLESEDYMSLYSHNLREMIRTAVLADDRRHPLRGLGITVDANGGTGGFYAPHILKVLGADILSERPDLHIIFDREALTARVRDPAGREYPASEILNDVSVPQAANVTSPALNDGTYLVSKLVIKLALLQKNGAPLTDLFQTV